MSKWQTKKLSKVTEKIFSGGTPATTNKAYWNGDINWLSSGETSNRFIFDTIQKISLLGVENSSTKLALQWDTVIASAGQGKTRGQTALLKVDSYINQSIIALRANRNEITPLWLFYNLSNRYSELRNISDSHSSRGSLTTALLKDLEISFPSINEQDKITGILFAIDNKIQLNTQTNQTLEQIAQAIFKHWFIDFAPVHAKANALARGETIEQAELAAMACLSGKTVEKITVLKTQDPTAYHQLQQTAAAFPSEFVETEMGQVPKGWGYKRAEDLFKIGIGKTPPRKESQWFSSNSKNNVEWISIKDMGNSGTHILNSSEYLTQEAIKNFNIKKIPENTVLLSFKLTIGRVSITTKETTTNEAIAHFKIGKSHLSTEFLYCYLKNFDFEQLGSTSSIATAVNSKTIKNMNILFPDIEVVNAFQKKISILFEKIKSNTKEISYLTSIRDELLPKLLNGEVEL